MGSEPNTGSGSQLGSGVGVTATVAAAVVVLVVGGWSRSVAVEPIGPLFNRMGLCFEQPVFSPRQFLRVGIGRAVHGNSDRQREGRQLILYVYRPDTAAQREKSLVEPGIFHVIFQCINRSKTRHTFWAHFRHLFPNTFKHNHTPPYNTNHHTKSYTVYINVVLVNFGKKNIFFSTMKS